MNYFTYRKRLNYLKTTYQKLDEKYKTLEASKEKMQQEDYLELNDLARESDEVYNWIESLKTEYFTDKCNQLVIPLPPKEDSIYYYKFDFNNDEDEQFIFTTEGFQFARTAIRKEIKERREAWAFWLTTATGIIGGLIGLITIIKIRL